MNFQSLRFRLSLTSFIAIFVTSLVLFGSFYYATMEILKSQTDREITSHAQTIIQLIQNESSGVHLTLPKEKIAAEFAQMPGMLVAVSDGNGKQLTTSQPVDQGMPVIQDTLEKSSNIIKPTFVDRKIGTISMRAGIFPVIKDGTVVSLIMVAHPVDVITRSLNNLAGILGGIMLGVGLPAALVTYFFTKRSISPLSRLTNKLQEVETTNLNQQLPVPHTQDEIQQLTSTFNSMLARLDESFGREKQFIGDVAHELKTPLATLISSVEVTLTKDRSPKDLKHVLSTNLIELNRLSATINDVLDLAWSQSGEIASQFDKVDLSSVTIEVVELIENLGASKKIKVVSEIASGIIVMGIRQKLFRAIYNLADNAVKYTPMNGRVAISLRQKDSLAILEVSNTGQGINPTDLPLVFKRFYRGKDVNSGGTGLGLSICKSIIEAHQGSITVDSHPGKITTFTVKLPQKSQSS